MQQIDISPAAFRLTTSLRDIGYDFVTAVADIVDNSIEAGASTVQISLDYDGEDSWVRIADDGAGMAPKTLNEALRFGTRRSYADGALGRYGLGLKTASLSQCRRLIVITRTATERRRIHARAIDLDFMARTDSWAALEIPAGQIHEHLIGRLETGPGTAVVWANLDRVFEGLGSIGGHGRRRMKRLALATAEHLGMVFHRFIDGEATNRGQVKFTVNDETVESWDPFARSEPMTSSLPVKRFALGSNGTRSIVTFRPYVLPHRDGFSSQQAFERYAGPNRWNRQQGLYVYRADRLIQAGGWAGMRAIDEHTKFARAAIDFDPVMDELFKVNVAKMKVSLPVVLRTPLLRSINELVGAAQAQYRRGERDSRHQRMDVSAETLPNLGAVGIAIRAAALEAGETVALERIEEILRLRASSMAEAMGWTG